MQLAIDQPFDLENTLKCGQGHRWLRSPGERWLSTVIGPHIRQAGGANGPVEFHSTADEARIEPLLRRQFRLDDDIEAIYADLRRRDAKMAGLNGALLRSASDARRSLGVPGFLHPVRPQTHRTHAQRRGSHRRGFQRRAWATGAARSPRHANRRGQAAGGNECSALTIGARRSTKQPSPCLPEARVRPTGSRTIKHQSELMKQGVGDRQLRGPVLPETGRVSRRHQYTEGFAPTYQTGLLPRHTFLRPASGRRRALDPTPATPPNSSSSTSCLPRLSMSDGARILPPPALPARAD